MLPLYVILLLIVAVAGSGIMTAILAWLLYRLNRLESGGRYARQLDDDFTRLGEQLASVRKELTALTERVDFTEDLLEDHQIGGRELEGGEHEGREPSHARLPPS